MTNVQLPGGEVVQGIRRNNDLGHDGAPQAPFEPPQPMRPLRYTPGLKCDPALEAMRPERQMKHQPIQGGDQWKQKLIQTPQTFSGSLADADMQKFRPYPIESPMEDPWFVSRLPDQPVGGAMPYMGGFQGGFAAPYPTDQLSQIKMRNRRFQQSCAMEGMQGSTTCPNDERTYDGSTTDDDATTNDRRHDDDGRHAEGTRHDRPRSQHDKTS